VSRELIHLSQAAPVAMADEWYEIADAEHFWMRWRMDALSHWSEFLPSVGETVMEVGCGAGAVLEALEKRFGYIADGSDLNLYALEQAGPGQGSLMVYDVLSRQAQLKDKYAAVFLMDVIEHIDDDVDFVKAAADLVRPEGMVVVNVPCSNLLYSKYDEVAGHVRRYSRAHLKKTLEEADLVPVHFAYWGFSLLPVIVARNLLCKFTSREKVIERGFAPPNRFAHTFLQSLRQLEFKFLKNPPFGTSLLGFARKLG
jgi:SAM-dependent methyltransferase